MTRVLQVYTHKYCDGDSMVTYSDTSKAYVDTSEFEISGNTLKIYSLYMDTLESNAVIQHATEMTRQGAGSGLIGIWRLAKLSYRVVSGTPTQEELGDMNTYGFIGPDFIVEEEFTESLIKARVSGTPDFAQMFIENWNFFGNSAYDITVQRLSNTSVKLTGNQSKEVVTINFTQIDLASMKSTETFTSSVASHAPYTYYDKPVTCPNEYYPTWWEEFQSDNYGDQISKRKVESTNAQSALTRAKAAIRLQKFLDGHLIIR